VQRLFLPVSHDSETLAEAKRVLPPTYCYTGKIAALFVFTYEFLWFALTTITGTTKRVLIVGRSVD
jgi:hypothetical protein